MDYVLHKQQMLSGRKLSRFLQIFNESQNFSLLIDRRHAIDIIMEPKSQQFSQHFHKSYQTTKLFSCLKFVVYSIHNRLHSWKINTANFTLYVYLYSKTEVIMLTIEIPCIFHSEFPVILLHHAPISMHYSQRLSTLKIIVKAIQEVSKYYFIAKHDYSNRIVSSTTLS